MHLESKRSQEVILGVKTTLNEVIKTSTFAPDLRKRDWKILKILTAMLIRK